MRITNNAIVRTSLASIQDNLRRVGEAHQRATSGLRISRVSDDPAGAAQVLGADRGLRALEQYRRNIDNARTRLDAEETALTQLSDLLTRARELGLAQASATSNDASMEATLAEVEALIHAAIQLGNTKLGDSYLFGGAHAHDRPFADDGSVSADRPPIGTTQVEVGAGAYAPASHDGQTAFVDTGAIAALQSLRDALAAGDRDAVAAAAGDLATAFDAVQAVIGDVGARSNRLALASSNVEALEFNLKTLRSDLAEVDLEEALTDLVSRQTTLQAAMAAASRMLSTTLADYL
ncbi:MAG: flagellar hook-associated protein FlgL [Candidatus Cloacimonetes bacterium]|nr:flagellar hook-associated protein FlgL [Candidatus Cloacimonadota bacterium]